MSGEFDSLDTWIFTVTGDITFDFLHDDDRRRVVPYVAAAAGYLRQTTVGSGPDQRHVCPSR